MTHYGRSERDHDAPLFAKPPVVGSDGNRLPAKYLGWSESARSRGFSGLVRVHPDSEEFRSGQRAAGHFCGSLYSQSGGIRLPKIAGAVHRPPGPPCADDYCGVTMFDVRRREFIMLVGGAAANAPLVWPRPVRAQLQPKPLRVGFVGMQPRESSLYTNFLKRMAELGYQEGRNFTFDYLQTPNIEGYEKNYRELAARKVDVFLAVGNEPALHAALSA